jgi:replicative DNA helicase
MITQAQKSVIGCILLDSESVMPLCVNAEVKADWFHGDAAKMYQIAIDRYIEGKPTNAVSGIQGLSDEAHILATACIDAVNTVAHAGYDIDVLRNEVVMDQAAILAEAIVKEASKGVVDVNGFIEKTARSWSDLIINQQDQETEVEVGLRLIDRWQDPETHKDRITWPLPSLNEIIGVLEKDFVFIAAEPSVGKTAIMLMMCDTLGDPGRGNSMTTSFASLESPADTIVTRRVGRIARLNMWQLKNGLANAAEYELARKVTKQLPQFKTRMHYQGMSLEQIRAWAFREKAAGSRLLVIDNMKHVRMDDKGRSTPEVFMLASMGLKHIRDDVGLPMIVLHHLAKNGDMAWSSDIERDADIVCYLKENSSMSSEPTAKNPGQFVVDWEVRKNRDGGRYITRHLNFIKGFQDFRDL